MEPTMMTKKTYIPPSMAVVHYAPLIADNTYDSGDESGWIEIGSGSIPLSWAQGKQQPFFEDDGQGQDDTAPQSLWED